MRSPSGSKSPASKEKPKGSSRSRSEEREVAGGVEENILREKALKQKLENSMKEKKRNSP